MSKLLWKSLSILLFCIITGTKVYSQTAAEAMTHPVIMRYYTASELQYLEANAPQKLAAIIYYYTASFVVEPISCNDCVPFDSTQFDVSQYEQFRQLDQAYVRVYEKYGFKLTLLPVSQLVYTIPIQERLIPQGENNPH